MADVPAGVVTVTSTVPVPAGLSAVIVVSLTTVTFVAAVVPKSTAVAPVKPVPVIVTKVPPAVGTAGRVQARDIQAGRLSRPGGVLGAAGERRRDLGHRHRPILDRGHPGVDPGGVADAAEEVVVIAIDRDLGRFERADETSRDRTPARPGSEDLGPGVDPRLIARVAEDVLVERLHKGAVSDVLGVYSGEERNAAATCPSLAPFWSVATQALTPAVSPTRPR